MKVWILREEGACGSFVVDVYRDEESAEVAKEYRQDKSRWKLNLFINKYTVKTASN